MMIICITMQSSTQTQTCLIQLASAQPQKLAFYQ